MTQELANLLSGQVKRNGYGGLLMEGKNQPVQQRELSKTIPAEDAMTLSMLLRCHHRRIKQPCGTHNFYRNPNKKKEISKPH
jgi:hypothetical protein